MRHGLKMWAVAGIFLTGCEAAGAEPATAALKACAKVTDATARLQCFDREVAALTAENSPPKAPAAVELSPQQKLGLSQARIEQLESQAGAPTTPKVTKLAAHIAHVSENAAGLKIFTLDNGQVWQQTEPEFNFSVRAGDAVTISPGVLGSFWLTAGPRAASRVKRLQ
jgi:hypothetical protein